MRTVLQSQRGECALACLAMIADAHGSRVELATLRQQFTVSLKGATLTQVVAQAEALGFLARPLRLEISELNSLKVPCILHWDLNHFVVLSRVRAGRIAVRDPAVGERTLSLVEVSRHFTGVALELTPSAGFEREAPTRLSLEALTGNVSGLRRSLAQVLAVALAMEVFIVAAPIFNQLVVDDVLTSGDRELLSVLVLGFALMLLVQTSLGLARSWMVMVLGQSLSLQWASNVFAHLIRLPMTFFENRHVGDIASRFAAIQTIQKTLSTGAAEALLDGLMVLAALTMMFLYAPVLAWITSGAAACYGMLRWLAFRPLRNAAAKRLVLSAQENSYFVETIQSLQAIKLYGREEGRRTNWQNLVVDVQNQDARTAKLTATFAASSNLLFGLENLLVFWVGAGIVMKGQASGGAPFTIGMLLAYITYKNQFTGRTAALINYAIDVCMLRLHAARLADIVLTPQEPRDLSTGPAVQLEATIEFRDVGFRYSDGERWVLRHLSFKIGVGDSVAVVGASGAGKTTLIKILLGVLKPEEGNVLCGGTPIAQLGLKAMRNFVGTVMQDDMLLSGTLAENISCFDVHADQELIERCARQAHIHGDIARMPLGYQTSVGACGSGLSGGQRQRILLARALYKQPGILVLDEGTSQLDIHNERAVLDALKGQKLTRISIAHRPETIAAASRVLELRHGHAHEVHDNPTSLRSSDHTHAELS